MGYTITGLVGNPWLISVAKKLPAIIGTYSNLRTVIGMKSTDKKRVLARMRCKMYTIIKFEDVR